MLIDPVSNGRVDPWNQDLLAKLWLRLCFWYLSVGVANATAVLDEGAVHVELAKLGMGPNEAHKFVVGSGEVEQSECL